MPATGPTSASASFDSEQPDTWGFAPAAPGLGPRRTRGPALLLGRGRAADLVGRHRARRQFRQRSALGTRRSGAGRPAAGVRHRILATWRDDPGAARLDRRRLRLFRLHASRRAARAALLAERFKRSAVAKPVETGA